MTEKEILEKIRISYQQILGDKLVGIYVHGSIAFGCFNWNKSDIDFIVVANNNLTLSEKISLIDTILELDEHCPVKGIEMSVVLERFCYDFVYPTPYELHFSNTHKDKCIANIEGYCRTMNGTDKDLAAHFTVIRHVGYALCGADIEAVFGEVPKANYIDSIKYDIADARTDIDENPVYFILNLCRVLAYLRDGIVTSKAQGALWGTENLPERYHSIITYAKESYCGSDILSADKNEVHDFAAFALSEIFSD